MVSFLLLKDRFGDVHATALHEMTTTTDPVDWQAVYRAMAAMGRKPAPFRIASWLDLQAVEAAGYCVRGAHAYGSATVPQGGA